MIPVSTLKRCFKGVYGRTVYQWIKECRMEEAKRLLLETEIPILLIANRIGYENSSKFTVAFKDATALKPSEYRKIVNNENKY